MFVLLLIPLVSGIDFCSRTTNPDTVCRLITPVIVCDNFNYEIINSTGTIVQNDSLTLLNDSLYFADINLSVGDYIVKLCDNTTKELFIEEVGDVNWIAIIISLSMYTLLLGFITFIINNPKLKGLKALFFLLTIVNTLLLPMFTFFISTGDASSFKPVSIAYLSINGLLLVFVIYLYALHLIRNVWSDEDDDF